MKREKRKKRSKNNKNNKGKGNGKWEINLYLYVVEGKRGGAGRGTENKSQRVKSITYDDFAFLDLDFVSIYYFFV